MGHTQFKTRESFLRSEEYLVDRIAVLTAGKIAQRILQESFRYFPMIRNVIWRKLEQGKILESVQGDSDLSRAQKIADDMVKVYGMGKHTGQVNLSGMVQGTPYGDKELFSGETKRLIDIDRNIIMQEGRKIAEAVLEENKGKLIEIVNFLNKHEVMTEENLQQILGQKISEDS